MSQATFEGTAPEGKNENFPSSNDHHPTESNVKTESNNQPNVRHIPIFVEGRDEPIINRNVTIDPENIQKPSPPIHDAPHPQSIFNRAKTIPVRKPSANFEIPVTNIRSESPARTIPIKVEHVQTTTKPKTPSGNASNNSGSSVPKNHQSNLANESTRSRSPSPMPPPKPVDSITKIQQIQKEIIELMKRVENFQATSRKDKEYVYLDEMLTQNLLKLDTIDTEGKDNIKAARKEAINCINKCIAVLEAKVEQAEKEGAAAGAAAATTNAVVPSSSAEASLPSPPTSSTSTPAPHSTGAAEAGSGTGNGSAQSANPADSQPNQNNQENNAEPKEKSINSENGGDKSSSPQKANSP